MLLSITLAVLVQALSCLSAPSGDRLDIEADHPTSVQHEEREIRNGRIIAEKPELHITGLVTKSDHLESTPTPRFIIIESEHRSEHADAAPTPWIDKETRECGELKDPYQLPCIVWKPEQRNTSNECNSKKDETPREPGYIDFYPPESDVAEDNKPQHGRRSTIQARWNDIPYCGSRSDQGVKCDNRHAARNEYCELLIASFEQAPLTRLPASPRSICWKGKEKKDNKCCLSWGRPYNGLLKADLIAPAQHMVETCSLVGVSAQMRDIQVGGPGGECLQMCMSNREDGCSEEHYNLYG